MHPTDGLALILDDIRSLEKQADPSGPIPARDAGCVCARPIAA